MAEANYRQQAAKWYKSRAWQQLRSAQLSAHPYCQCPHHKGKDRSAVATIVDHKTPHRGNKAVFFDRKGLQSMTKQCHDSFKQSQERGGAGFKRGCDEHGNPLLAEHEWWS